MNARFTGSLDPAIEAVAERLRPLAEAGARIARDAVVEVIETSVPRGEMSRTAAGIPYRASAPGQPPASPTGIYPDSWGITGVRVEGGRVRSSAATDSTAGPELEFGDPGPPQIEPRPHARPAVSIAAERIGELLQELQR